MRGNHLRWQILKIALRELFLMGSGEKREANLGMTGRL